MENGLSESEATLLATRTAIGAGRMLESTIESAAELRRKVTSPGGTTAAAIARMSAGGFEHIIADAIRAATERGARAGWQIVTMRRDASVARETANDTVILNGNP